MPDDRLIDAHRRAWDTKPVLRAIYEDYHRRIAAKCVPGRTLEIGGGSGHMKTIVSDVISVDIQSVPWLDAVADAHTLPFSNGSIANVVMLDVLHHLKFPIAFLQEATRVLNAGGRLVLIEPDMTPVSRFFLSRFHPEPVDLSARPLSGEAQSGSDPEDANQAVPYLLFRRHLAETLQQVPELRLASIQRLSLWAYPLSGGFRRWSLLPAFMVPALVWMEEAIMPLLGPLAAFRMIVVMEKRT